MHSRATAIEPRRDNNIGVLRLLFASLVIVSHSPELVDGNRSREILTRLFGTLSFGELAVDGFFLLSGYLITQSFLKTSSLWTYFIKRIARIFPGYIVAFMVCVVGIAPLVGGVVSSNFEAAHILTRAVLLLSPEVPGVFKGLHYSALNGPMWAIAYEFRCYVLTAILGTLGVFSSSRR